jgi:hypothetical protein
MGRIEEALPIFRRVFAANPDWAQLLTRLPSVGVVKLNEAQIQQILAVSK